MKYFKDKKICHRDLKFENILIKRINPDIKNTDYNSAFNLIIKVADLGCAKEYYTNG